MESHRFSNGGHYVLELEARLAELHQVRHVISYANASFALLAVLSAVSRKDAPDIALPSFSYRGLPHFVQWAGRRPRFCDVDAVTHALSLETVGEAAASGDVAAVLAVNNVTAPADFSGLDTLGIPVVYDSVYAIAACWKGRPFGRNGVAEVFSLHATKLLNGFEGGYVTTDNGALADRLRDMRNFGFDSRSPQINCLGMNGKLNEIHAAMAVTSLEELDQVLARNRSVHERYGRQLAGIPGLKLVEPVEGMKSNHEMILVDVTPDFPLTRDDLLAVLQAEGAMARPYFSPPLHRSEHAPPGLELPPLPVTEMLAKRLLQLPVGAFVSDCDIDAISALLQDISDTPIIAAPGRAQARGALQ